MVKLDQISPNNQSDIIKNETKWKTIIETKWKCNFETQKKFS